MMVPAVTEVWRPQLDGEFSTSGFIVDAYLADVALQNLVVTDASKSPIDKLLNKLRN